MNITLELILEQVGILSTEEWIKVIEAIIKSAKADYYQDGSAVDILVKRLSQACDEWTR